MLEQIKFLININKGSCFKFEFINFEKQQLKYL